MKRIYLKPEVLVVDFCSANMLAASVRMIDTNADNGKNAVDGNRTGWGDLWK